MVLPVKVRTLSYVCSVCKKAYNSRSGLLSHKHAIHLRRKPYRCRICNERFLTFAARVAHGQRVHPGVPPLSCRDCGEVSSSLAALEDHSRLVHEGNTSDEEVGPPAHQRRVKQRLPQRDMAFYACLDCNKTFPKAGDLLSHLEMNHEPLKEEREEKEVLLSVETHSPYSDRLRPFSQPKECCNRQFDEPHELEIHNKYHHRRRELCNEEELLCNTCTREFKSNEDLSLHQSLFCGLSFLCKPCDKRFKKVGSYIEHLQGHHHSKEEEETSLKAKNEDKLLCAFCGVAFYERALYETHVRGHEAQTPCRRCNYRSASAAELRYHYEEKHAFVCRVCFKIFSTSSALNYHNNIQHTRPCLCPLCPRDCHSLDVLLRHLDEQHAKDVFIVPRACDKCSFETLQVNSYLSHMKDGHTDSIFL